MKFDHLRLATVVAVSTAMLSGCGPTDRSAANCGDNRDWNSNNSGTNPNNCVRTGGGGHMAFIPFFFGFGRGASTAGPVSRGGFGGTGAGHAAGGAGE